MRSQYILAMLLIALLAGCVHAPSIAPPFAPTSPIIVLPPTNRTNDLLTLTSNFFWPFASSRSPQLMVADVLAAEARTQLIQRGFTVISAEEVATTPGVTIPNSLEEATDLVSQGKLTGNALYIEIKRWEADDLSVFRPKQVLVALDASLIDAATGRVVWTARCPLRPTPTPGATSLWAADLIAAHTVIDELLRSWKPAPPSS